MNIIVFEDSGVEQLFPVTTGRPAYSIGCGSFRLADYLTDLKGHQIGLVRPYLETIQLHDFPQFKSQVEESFPVAWIVNARLVPSISNVQRLIEFKDTALERHAADIFRGTSVIARQGWAIASALVNTKHLAGKGLPQLSAAVQQLNDPMQTTAISVETELNLFEFPHDVVNQNMKTLAENLNRRISTGHYQQREEGVFMGKRVTYGQHVVFDASKGPIVIDDDASLGPFSLLRGPVYLGPHSRLSEYAAIKDHVSVARNCKLGGEIEASVIESYTNKQHHGFLGHSYLGSWINLGAGTCNSDLKNTYGTVNVEYGERKVSTGMQFFGCVIGDYSKTAINTSIFTGKIVGAASMIYGFTTTNVPSFVNYARTFNGLSVLPPDIIVATQARMFSRRNVQQRPCDVQLIHDMYRITAPERPNGLSETPLLL